jgi:hypothetical protein
MHYQFIRFIIIVLIGGSIAGCTDGIDPGPCRTVDCQPVSYHFSIDRFSFQNDTVTTVHLEARASFQPYSEDIFPSVYAEAGRVTLNGMELGRQGPLPDNSIILYSRRDPLAMTALAAPGMTNVWDVRGSAEVVPMTVSVPSPRTLLDAVAPGVGEAIVVDSALAIRWTPPHPADSGATADSLYVMLMSAEASENFSRSVKTYDDGEITIPRDSLLRWNVRAGESWLVIGRTTRYVGLAPDGRVYAAGIYETVQRRFVLLY